MRNPVNVETTLQHPSLKQSRNPSYMSMFVIQHTKEPTKTLRTIDLLFTNEEANDIRTSTLFPSEEKSSCFPSI